MILISSLFPRSPLGVTIDHEAKSAGEDYEDEDQEYERWHNDILCCCIPKTFLARDARNTCPFSCETRGKRPSQKSRSQWRDVNMKTCEPWRSLNEDVL